MTQDCDTCAEPGSGIEGECPMSKRSCGHHCNCVWVHDVCHWCGAEINEDGDLIPNYAPVDLVASIPENVEER